MQEANPYGKPRSSLAREAHKIPPTTNVMARYEPNRHAASCNVLLVPHGFNIEGDTTTSLDYIYGYSTARLVQ